MAIPLTQGGPTDHGNYEAHWTGPYAEAHLLSDLGKRRHNNEDACVMCAPVDETVLEQRGLLFAVADGMGGASAGELASRLALETLLDEYYGSPKTSIPELLRQALLAANRRVFVESVKMDAYRGMGTTVSAVLIHDENAYIAQVGDSRVYIKRRDESLVQVTNDHSLVAEQVRNGSLSPEEARTHVMKNLITRAVGIKGTLKVDLFAMKLKQDDIILVCSDGLSGLVEDDEIESAIVGESLQDVARSLLCHALDQGGTDNVTTILIRITQTPPLRELQIGAVEVALGSKGFLGKLRNYLHKDAR